MKLLDFNTDAFTGGFALTIDPTKIHPEPRSFIVLSYPNQTQATISGDPEVVKQIVDRLDHQDITFTCKGDSNGNVH